MKNLSLLLLAMLAVLLTAPALGDDDGPRIVGNYHTYSLDPPEYAPPTTKDMKVYFLIKGELAKQLYAQLPRGKSMCQTNTQFRSRGDIECGYDPDTKETFCNYRLNVQTGKFFSGTPC